MKLKAQSSKLKGTAKPQGPRVVLWDCDPASFLNDPFAPRRMALVASSAWPA